MERRCRTAKSQYLNRVITYMRDHLQENLTLTRIAREAGLSESYLNAVFKECVKCAPMDYYINMKMEQACYLLCNTDMHITINIIFHGHLRRYWVCLLRSTRKCQGYRQLPCRFPVENLLRTGKCNKQNAIYTLHLERYNL